MSDSLHGERNSLVSTTLLLVLIFFGSCFFAWIAFSEKLYSGSVDLAHHLALAEALRGSLVLPETYRPILNSMFEYPNLSHRIAATLLEMGVGPIEAMNLVAVASIIATWSMLLVLLARASTTSLLLVAFLAICCIATIYPGFLIGFEIIGNFFYAQVVGDTLFVGLAILGWTLARSTNSVPLAIFSFLAVAFTALFHLLPALRLLFALEMMLAICFALRWLSDRSFAWPALGALILNPALFLLHPSYTAMKKLAENNGALSFGIEISIPTITIVSMLLLAILVVALAITTLVKPARENAASRIEAAVARIGAPDVLLYLLGGAVAVAALAQVLQLSLLQAGSEYAVRKHVFGVATFGLASIACFAGTQLDRIAFVQMMRSGTALGAVAAIAISGFLFLRPNIVDVPALARISQGVAEIKATPFELKNPSQWPLFASSSLPASLSYLETVGVLFSPQAPDPNAMSVLSSQKIADWNAVSYVLATEGDPGYDAPECRKGAAVLGVVRLDKTCLMQSKFSPRSLNVGDELAFTSGTPGAASLNSGWWPAESWGAWSVGPTAVLEVSLSPAIPTGSYEFQLDADAFVHPKDPERHIRIRIDDGPELAETFSVTAASRTISVPYSGSGGRSIRITFTIENPNSPEKLGLSVDGRMLGIGVKRMRMIATP